MRTRAASVRAEKVVLATNAYTPGIGRLTHTVCPVYVTLFETAPLSDAQLAAVGWTGREGIYTAHEILESYRLTARRTIVGGSKQIHYRYGSALHTRRDRATERLLERAFRDRFPELADLPIAHFWGGWIAMTFHFLPAVGRTGGAGNVYYAVGYNGHGVAAASACGAILADVITNRPNDYADMLERWVPPLPPEPLRWLIVYGLNRALEAIDARTDRQVRARG